MRTVFVVLLLTCTCGYASDAPLNTDAPDLVLLNGTIYTMDNKEPEVQALAITDGRITALGDSVDVAALAGDGTQQIDLNGQVVLPGFHDMHVHPIFAGLQAMRCVIPQGSSMRALLAEVSRCVDRAKPGEWVTGGSWDASALGEPPTRQALDAVSGDTPVYLLDTSVHSAWANSRALALAGVTRDTPDPLGGIIERDSDGVPTGVFRESANVLIGSRIPPPTDEAMLVALKWALDEMLSYGITSLTEASAGFNAGTKRDLEAYMKLVESQELKQRIRICIAWEPGLAEVESFIQRRDQYNSAQVTVDCVKLFLDGVPTDSHTAAMLDPYEGMVPGRDDEASVRGMLMMPQQAINDALDRYGGMGLAVKFHAAGDAAVRAGLTSIAHAWKQHGSDMQRHDVGHSTFVAEEDMPWAKKINATFEVSPYLWSPSPINDDITKAVGQERIKRVWPIRELIESGALVIPGSDWAVVPSVNPWIAIEALVTRESPGGSERSFGKDQAISVAQALKLFTVNSAKHLGRDNKLGKLTSGYLADLVVIDQDPYSIPVRTLHQVQVTKTIINGEVVYRDKD